MQSWFARKRNGHRHKSTRESQRRQGQGSEPPFMNLQAVTAHGFLSRWAATSSRSSGCELPPRMIISVELAMSLVAF